MPSLKIQPFGGQIPKISALLLPGPGAQRAVNTKLMSGEIRAWRKALAMADPIVASAKSLHRLYGAAGSKFLSWTADVDVVGSPLTDVSDYRAYYAGETTPRKTNWALAISGPGPYPFDYLEMGVPAPSAAPTLTVTNGAGGTAEDRVYLITHVSTFGTIKEESAPSAVATCTVPLPTGSSVLVNAFPALPGGKYNITHRRIYRNLIGTSNYGLLTEIPVATASYADTAVSASSASLLTTLNWTPPPSGLKGLVTMPNGMVAGFVGNQVYFCEPYFLHAWPVSYMLTVDYPIVGLGVYGSTLVVLTEGFPYLMTGSHPAAMSQETIKMPEPCVAKRAIASNESGVLYPSPNGVVGIGQGVRGLISEYAYTRDDWQALVPANLFGALFGRNYILFNGGEAVALRSAIVFPVGDQSGVSTINSPARAFHVDRKTGDLFIASESNNVLYQLDASPVNYDDFDWLSREFVLPQPVSFACGRVNADFSYMNDNAAINAAVAAIIAANLALYGTGAFKAGEVNGARMNTYRVGGGPLQPVPEAAGVRYASLTIYADDVLYASVNITSIEEFRLPDGLMAHTWEIRATGNVPVRSVALATSIDELRQVI